MSGGGAGGGGAGAGGERAGGRRAAAGGRRRGRGRAGAGGRRSTSTSNYMYGNLNLHLITDGKAAAPTLSLLIPQPPPGHDPVRVSYPWAPMC